MAGVLLTGLGFCSSSARQVVISIIPVFVIVSSRRRCSQRRGPSLSRSRSSGRRSSSSSSSISSGRNVVFKQREEACL